LREIRPVISKWRRWHKFHKGRFPDEFTVPLLMDILHVSKEDIDNMSLMEITINRIYAEETYLRRDYIFVNEMLYGKKKKGNALVVPQDDIEDWIAEQYDNAKKGTILPNREVKK
jgi:hypothetical protein